MTALTAPPAADPPPHLTSGGRNAFRALLVIAAALLLVLGLTGLGVAAWGVSHVRVVADHQALPATMRTLVVDTGEVPVAIRIDAERETREATADLRLVNTSESGAHRLVVDTEGTETRVSIAGNPSPALKWARGGEITVSVPPEQARRLTVRTEQQLGAVIATADLDQLVARARDGAIVLRGAARSIEAHTVNGEIIAREPIAVAERFSATTSSGDITVDFRDTAPRTVEAVSRSGNVMIGLPERGPYLVKAQSGVSAKVRVPETNDREAAVSEVTARSGTGEVVVDDISLGRR
ncbi:hypothetical protein GOARA_036_01330 [Gordonia araii NBRC 100433]|uniref:DUF4097 domain-containing protein n=1 Tax=Gordonia araii NBRC 100433 TaxID=1073574 RepID=G7H0M6_9ACTN|nr:DUF4097 family beta strand repeat-containing protein [Gordonia araii]NNG96836.1 hypothetical protein [Gordonia araii NBRC 100433]GAB09401.1 hypothetical protein GOARA_036_01330 [Gordonia araii NBRC 100433]